MRIRLWFFLALGVWVLFNTLTVYLFVPFDFFGDTAWYVQSALRWQEFGWPTTLVVGPVEARYGWGPFTPWLYLISLLAWFKIADISLLSLKLLGLFPMILALIAMFFIAEKLAPPKGIGHFLLLLLLLLSPPSMLMFRAKPIEAIIALWLVICLAFILLPDKRLMRLIGFLLLPLVFWLNPLAGLLPLCLFVAMLVLNFLKRDHLAETACLALGGFLVLGLSLLFSLLSGHLSFAPAETGIRLGLEISWGVGWLKPLAIILFSGAVAFMLFETGRKGKGIPQKPLVLAILGGLVFLPVLTGIRVTRIQDFISLPAFLLLYLYYTLALQKPWQRSLLLALFALLICLQWIKATPWKYAGDNLSYMGEIHALVDRNLELIHSRDTVLMSLRGTGLVFLALPRDKILTAARYRGEMGSRSLAFVSDLDADSSLVAADSVALDSPYSYYGFCPVRKVYLFAGEE